MKITDKKSGFKISSDSNSDIAAIITLIYMVRAFADAFFREREHRPQMEDVIDLSLNAVCEENGLMPYEKDAARKAVLGILCLPEYTEEDTRCTTSE